MADQSPGTEKEPGCEKAINLIARREHFLLHGAEHALEACPHLKTHIEDARWMIGTIMTLI